MAETWNETTPAGTHNPKQGDDRIRELKRAIRERLAADHHFESTEGTPFGDSGSEIGFHKKVILIEQASDPVTLANEIAVYCKDDGGTPEVFLRNESNGTVWQISKGGKLLHNSVILPEQTSAPSTAANQVAVYSKEISAQSELFARCESDGTEIQLTSAGAIILNDHAANHVSSEDEIDGDKVDIDWTPTNYTPAATPSEADDADDLTAHLYGIDQAIATAIKRRYLVDSDATYGLWTNTTQKKTLVSLSLYANLMGTAGIAYCETVGFAIKNNTSFPRDFTIGFDVDGTPQLTKTFSIPISGWIECVLRAKLMNKGATNQNYIQLECHHETANNQTAFKSNATIDTTGASTITLTGTMGSGDAEFEFRTYGGFLEVARSY